MKTHSRMLVDFHSSVKLNTREENKIHKWLDMASLVMDDLLFSSPLVHSSWLKNVQSIQVSVLLCGTAKIRKLNHEYRQKDYVTDVLSFPAQDSFRVSRPKEQPHSPVLFLGDLAICHQKTIQQAKDFKITYWDEFIHLYIHGIIHLLGYDHELSPKEEKLMQEWEKKALDLFSDIKKGAR